MAPDFINCPTAKACCYQHSLNPQARFCGDCRAPLLRCMAYEECGGLVGEDGRCTVCVRPQIFLDAGAVRDVKVGGSLVLPLMVRNDSPKGRPLFITHVWTREGEGEKRRQELAWERLDSGATAPVSFQTQPLVREGRTRIEVSFTAATRYRWREEVFGFVATLELEVEGGGALVINQTISAAGSATAYAPIRVEGGARRDRLGQPAAQLQLVRGDRFERQGGFRGFGEQLCVHRAARIEWRGFVTGEAPANGPITTADGLLALGRGPTKRQGGEGDVNLLIRKRTGEIDCEGSLDISRRHLDLFIQGGRLCLHVASENGARIGDRFLPRDTIATLEDGDLIHILPRRREAIALAARMTAHHGVVEHITIQRLPAH